MTYTNTALNIAPSQRHETVFRHPAQILAFFRWKDMETADPALLPKEEYCCDTATD